MDNLYKYLTTEQKMIWDSYLDLKAKGIKSQSKDTLERFIESIKKDSAEIIDLIALELKDLNNNHGFQIQFPLFKDILLPTLIKYAKQNKPGFYRIIAEYEQYFHSDNRLTEYINSEFNIDEKFFDTISFYNRELSINPKDSKAANLLVNRLAQGLDYAIHELPDYGLCWDFDYFSESIDKLENLISTYGFDNSKWTRRIDLLKAIRKTWADYLNHKDNSNYKDYLELIDTDESKIILNWPKELIYDKE